MLTRGYPTGFHPQIVSNGAFRQTSWGFSAFVSGPPKKAMFKGKMNHSPDLGMISYAYSNKLQYDIIPKSYGDIISPFSSHMIVIWYHISYVLKLQYGVLLALDISTCFNHHTAVPMINQTEPATFSEQPQIVAKLYSICS